MATGFGSFQARAPAPSGPRARPTCESCRQRKVRCNRKLPCAHCCRLQLSCVYEKRMRRAPLKAPSRTSGSVRSTSPVSASGNGDSGEASGESSNREILQRLNKVEKLLSTLVSSLSPSVETTPPTERNGLPGKSRGSSGKPLLVGGGQGGNYIDESVFVEMLLDDPNSANPQLVPPQRRTDNAYGTFGIVATDVFGEEFDDLSISPHIYTKLWNIYVHSVDQFLKILHLPTVYPTILEAIITPEQAGDTTMALLFAISFAATATTSKHEAEEQLGFERLKLLRYFMRRIDSSLGKAKILLYPSIEALQALVIYLSTLRTHDTSRAVWVLGGIAIRLAESLGVHQDGLRLGLSPFEAETRCRLWWIVTALDSSAPEDHGFDSTIADLSQSIRTPLNVNDADLFPQMAELPAEKEEWTEMTFSLANLDIHRTLRQTVVASSSKEISEQEKAIQNVQDVIWQRWLRLADPTKPICQVADAVLRISVLKTLFLCNLRSWLSNSSVRSEASSRYRRLPDKIFIAAVDLLEKVYILQSGRASRGFSWFYQQRPQLYAIFLVLHALKDGPDRLDADRAWRAVDNYSTCLTDFEEAHERKGRTSCVWRILGPLRETARESRRQMANGTFHLHSGEHVPQSSGTIEINNDATGAPAISDSSSRLPESYETLRQADPFAMEGMTFDSILAWQDFSGWFDVGQNTL